MALTGRLLVDNTDAYTTYGFVLKDYAPLLTMPTYKTVATNDWHEQDGLDADLTNPVLGGRQFALKFGLSHPLTESEAQAMLYALTSQVYHSFEFPHIGKTFMLRLVSNGSFAQNVRFDTLSLTFAEDVVNIPAVTFPTAESVPQQGYILDDADFALFGCQVVKGTRDTFLKFAQPKEALKRSISIDNGIAYDIGDTIRLKPRDITINLHIRTASVADFWAQWYALWNAVLKIDTDTSIITERAVRTIEGDGMTFRAYYKQNKVDRFLLIDGGGVWCDFSITFTVIAYSRGDEWYYLITEDGFPLLFQDDDSDDPRHYMRIR